MFEFLGKLSWAVWPCVALLLLAAVAALTVRMASVRRRQRDAVRAINDACAAPTDKQTLLVLIVTTRARASVAATTLQTLFDGAVCPFRVSAAVFEANARAKTSRTLAAYTSLARSATARLGKSFADQVRTLAVPPHFALGVHAARAALMAHAYAGHAFIVTLADDAQLVPGWDQRALDELAACGDPGAILVAPPASGVLKAPQFPTFSRFTKLGLPELTSRALVRFDGDVTVPSSSAETESGPLPVLFWTGNCSVAPAQAYATVPFDPSLQWLADGEDVLMSARLWTNGWNFYGSTRPEPFATWPAEPLTPLARDIVVEATQRAARVDDGGSSLATLRAATTASHEAARLLLGGGLPEGARPRVLHALGMGASRTLAQWEEFSAVVVSSQLGAGRAHLGVTPTAGEREIACKFGSQSEFATARWQFEA